MSKKKKKPVDTRWWPLAIAILAIVPFLNALANDFVLDDLYVIVGNPLIRNPANLFPIFATDYWSGTGALGGANDPGLYRALPVWSYSLDYGLWGLAPAGYHAVNILLHAITAVIVFRIAMRLKLAPIGAFVAAAIFAVHPIHTEAVTSVVGRAEVLATLFFALAFLLSMTAGGLQRSLGVGALYLLALSSKESAATFPLVLLLYDWSQRETWLADRAVMMRRLAIRYGPLLVAAAVYLAARGAALTQSPKVWVGWISVPAGDRILTAMRVLSEYVGLFLFPRTLLAEYSTSTVPIARGLQEPRVQLALLLLIVLAAMLYRFRRDRILLFTLGFAAITIVPISNVLFPIGVGKAERILYLPSIGLCLAVGWLAVKAKRETIVAGIAVLLVLALGIRTYIRNNDWRNQITLAQATLRDAPDSPLMSDIAGVELAKGGAVDRALPLFQRAVQVEPNIAAYQNHLGTAYFQLGQIDSAQQHVQAAIRLRPGEGDPHNVLGAILVQRNQIDSAIVEFNTALRINPNDAAARTNLEQALKKK